MDLHGGSGKTEAAGLGMNLQALTVPLHDVVVADDALWVKQQMRSRFSGAGRQAFSAWRGVRAKRRL